MTLIDWTILVLFAGLLLAVTLYFLAAIGHFPTEVRTAEIGTGAGPYILYCTIVLLVLAVAAGALLVWKSVPWYAAILGGGAAVLMAPLILPSFSDGFVDGRPALITFTALAYVALGGIWLIS